MHAAVDVNSPQFLASGVYPTAFQPSKTSPCSVEGEKMVVLSHMNSPVRSPFPGMDPFLEVDPSRQMFPEFTPTPYFILVARKTGLGRNEEGYPIRLQDRLPVIGLPIGPGRADLPLDLAAAFESAFDLSTQPASIDYQNETVPDPPLSIDDADFVKHLLKKR